MQGLLNQGILPVGYNVSYLKGLGFNVKPYTKFVNDKMQGLKDQLRQDLISTRDLVRRFFCQC